MEQQVPVSSEMQWCPQGPDIPTAYHCVYICVCVCNMTEQDCIFAQVGHSLLFCPLSVVCCVFQAWKK